MATRRKLAVCQRIRNAILGRRHRSSRASIEKSSAVQLTNVRSSTFNQSSGCIRQGEFTRMEKKRYKKKNQKNKNNDNQ